MKANYISSLQNPQVKRVQVLQQKSQERRRSGLTVVEGRREVEHCLRSGFGVDAVYYCPDLLVECPVERATAVSRAVYAKMAYRDSTEGILAVVHTPARRLTDLVLGEAPLVVVLESVEKPGNVGAVLRSADAAGVSAVVVCDPLTDLYNPNLIRSSLGAVFTVPCVECSTQECIDYFKERGIAIVTAQLQDSELYYATDMRGATAIVMGTESTGLSQAWREAADAHIRIPMLGALDSLNVSTSAAILIFEAVRQRAGGSPQAL